MDEASITQYIKDNFKGVDVMVASAEAGAPEVSWGDTFFYYGTERFDPFPFATIVTKDYGDFDGASNLNRAGVFRLNIRASRASFVALFGEQGAEGAYDFTALNVLMPHPVYGGMFWVCVLNPSEVVFQEKVRPLLAETYKRAMRKETKLGED